MNEQQKIGALEAMLFAHADPVEAARLADALRVEPEEALRLLKKLQRKLDEEESGMAILYFDPDRWQMATRPYYGEMVKRILDTRRNAPLSPAALEVLSVIAYNQPVSRSFIEQVRGVDSSSIVAKLLEKGLIEEAGRLDLPGKPIAFQVVCSAWARWLTCRRCMAKQGTTNPRKLNLILPSIPPRTANSWNGSDCP